MSTTPISERTRIAGECFKRAVRKELDKKAKLGQYVIINRDGRPCRVTAEEALKIADGKMN
jgi:hypothetical protein